MERPRGPDGQPMLTTLQMMRQMARGLTFASMDDPGADWAAQAVMDVLVQLRAYHGRRAVASASHELYDPYNPLSGAYDPAPDSGWHDPDEPE